MEKFTIIVPCYNEERTIVQVVESLKKIECDKDIIIINDGSNDMTLDLLKKIEGITVISQPYNKGNGASVKTGIINSKTENILVIDADGQHNPDDIKNIISGLDTFDMVIGARVEGSETSWFRNFGNNIFIILGKFLTGFDILDMTSGFRAFKKSQIIKFFNLYPNGFSFPTTSTMCFLTSGLNVKYIPIKSFKRVEGSKSKIKPFKDGMKFILIIFRIIMFNPLKIFLPVGLLLFFLGILWSIKTIYFTSSFSIGGILLLISGINLFFFGFIFDQIMAIRKDLIQKDLLK